MPKLKKLENGLVPPPQQQAFPVPQQQTSPSPVTQQPPQPLQQDVYNPGENTATSSMEFGGGVDIELEDLLAMDVQPDIGVYNSNGNNMPMPVSQSGYAFPSSTPSQTQYPVQAPYTTYQQPPVGQQPAFSSQLDDLYDILGEDNFLMDGLPNQTDMPYSNSPQSQNPVPNHYGRASLPYAPSNGSLPGLASQGISTAAHSSSPGSLTGFNVRPHQQVGGSVVMGGVNGKGGRGVYPQQLQRVMGRGGTSLSQPNRFPGRTSSPLRRQQPPVPTEPVEQVRLIML